MKKVQYVGDSHYREITTADWKALGVEDGPGKTVWDRDNRGGDGVHPRGKTLAKVHELEDDAADTLVAAMPKEFKVVDEPTDLPNVGTSPDAPAFSRPPAL